MAAAIQNKRKRDAHDVPGARAPPGMSVSANDFDQNYLETGDDGLDNAEGVMEFAAALAQHSSDAAAAAAAEQQNAGGMGQRDVRGPSNTDTAAAAMAQYHTMTVPQSTEQAFMQSSDGGDKQGGSGGAGNDGGNSGPNRTSSFGEFDVGGDDGSQEGDEGDRSDRMAALLGRNKPSVGSDEWHKQRRDNHKEVERRRRETINEGINELSKIVPGCEKNKGSILQRAVQFITQLKENESQNIEKWTLEKLLTEQAIAELSSSCDKLKAECQRAWAECEQWKKAGIKAGASIDAATDDDDKGDANGEDID